MLKRLHGFIEGVGLRVYRDGASQLNAQVTTWEGIELLSEPQVLSRIIDALNLLRSKAPRFADAVGSNLKTIICVNGVITKTLPVNRVLLINTEELRHVGQETLAFMLVQSAAYCSYYTDKVIFLPTVFLRNRDKQARNQARQFASAFRDEIAGNR